MSSVATVLGTAVVLIGAYVGKTYWLALRRSAEFRRLNPKLHIETILLSGKSALRLFDIQWRWSPIDLQWQMNWLLRNKFALFENRHNQMYARCTSDTTTVFIAEPALIREVLHRNKEFVKPVHMYGVLRFFGDNLVSTEGVDWKRHRKIVAPAFSEQNNILVHAASTRIAQEMFASWDRNKTGPRVQVSKDMTKFALAIISSAGFGIEFAWHDMNDKNVWHGHSLSFKNALEIVVQRAVAFAVMPKALKMLPFKWMKDTKKGYDEFNQYLDELLDREVPERPKNIVEMLLKASQEDSSAGLTRQELKGNAFVLIFAGHETTANTLSYALALLAIHQDKQESLYKESINVLEESQAPEYSDISKLTYALAVMNETLRHFPQPSTIPKYTADKTLILGDTVLPPKTVLSFATAALHMHTDIWGPDASEFKPERWNEKKESMLGFLPFSEGPRACLGKRFAQIEFITLLTMISVRYKWYVPDGVAEKELLESGTLLTTYPLKPIELIFTHRSNQLNNNLSHSNAESFSKTPHNATYFSPSSFATTLPHQRHSTLALPRTQKDASALAPPRKVPPQPHHHRPRNHPDVQLVNHADALYTATVSFGNNQTFQVDLDTGSSDVWIRGSMCTSWPWDNSCGIFKRSLDTRDETLERTRHTWKTKYGSGSVHGHVYRGPVTLGGVTTDLNFGVSVRERGFQSTGDGLWGLAYPAINQIEGGNWVQAAGIKSFAFYFSDNVNGDFGELTINGVDETKFTGEIQYVPLIEETYYEFAPDGSFVINDVEIPMTGTRAIADTGTSLMLLPDDISDQVNQAIGATFVHHFGLYIIPCSAAKTGPAITVNIGQASIVLTASEYILDGGNGQDCVSGISKIGNLAHGGRSPQYILGDTFLRAAYSVHDIENKRIGFAQAVHPKGDKGLVGAGGVVNHEALLAQAAADRIVDDIKQGFNDVKESIKNFVSGDKEEDKGASL